jgi:hypothetical protein
MEMFCYVTSGSADRIASPADHRVMLSNVEAERQSSESILWCEPARRQSVAHCEYASVLASGNRKARTRADDLSARMLALEKALAKRWFSPGREFITS